MFFFRLGRFKLYFIRLQPPDDKWNCLLKNDSQFRETLQLTSKNEYTLPLLGERKSKIKTNAYLIDQYIHVLVCIVCIPKI